MNIEKFTVSRDDSVYEAWPDIVLTNSGKLICIFAECSHHGDRSYTRIMTVCSHDRGHSWKSKKPFTEGTSGKDYYYNCPRISKLNDGRLVVVVDKIYGKNEHNATSKIVLFFSNDEGKNWGDPVETPARGIVPDKILELESGRWLLSCHHRENRNLVQRLWYSDNQGKTWIGPVVVGKHKDLNLCEASILPVGDSLVAFMRENSFKGLPCYKTISNDQGETWSKPIAFPMPGCHRPVSGFLNDGKIFVTYRFMQGGDGYWGIYHNFFGLLTNKEGALSGKYEAKTRIFSIDYDQNTESDTGYSGWVQFDNDEIYIVNYIMADAPKAFIRGYSLKISSNENF